MSAFELVLDPPKIISEEIFRVAINNRFDFAPSATGQENDFVLTVDDSLLGAELAAAARQLFSMLDQHENDADSR